MASDNSGSNSTLSLHNNKEAFSSADDNKKSMALSEIQPQRSRDEWQPGFWRRFPWIGVCSLMLALLMSIVAVIVLCVSDNKASSQWSYRIAPNVILSILNSCASVCFAAAVGRGIAISWWRRAAKGTTIHDLSRSWGFGFNTLACLTEARYFNVIALAALVTKISIIDGILFQRATTTYVALGPQTQHNMTTYPSDDFPPTGYYGADVDAPSTLDTFFTPDVSTWIRSGGNSVESTYGFNDCDGVCAVDYPAPGFAISCTSHTEETDVLANNFGGLGVNSTGSSTTVSLFDISFNYTHATPGRNYSWIGLNMTNYDTQDQTAGTQCPGKIVLQQCELRPAILKYPVVSEATSVITKASGGNTKQQSFVTVYLGEINSTDGAWEGISNYDPNLGQVPGFEILSYINLTGQATPYSETSVGGIMLAMQEFYASSVTFTVNNNDTSIGHISNQGLIGNLAVDSELPSKSNATCPSRTIDPLQMLVTYLNKLTFITADDIFNRPQWRQVIATANATQAQVTEYENLVARSIDGVQYQAEVHYKTDYGFMYGAIASTLLCVILVIPAYWGFWELGRQVSFDPVEVAHAFGAPALADSKIVGGNAKEIVTATGTQHVQYAEHETQGHVFQRVRS